MRNCLNILFRGIGQVMFQNNVLSGVLMFVGILVSDWRAAFLALAGNIAGNLTAWICRYPFENMKNGWYGFNGTLVGIAVGVFFRQSWAGMGLLIVGSAFSTWLTHLFLQARKPGYTAPFVLSVWMLMGAVVLWIPALISENESVLLASVSPHWFRALSFHFGQVMFQGASLMTGVCFLAGIAVNNRLDFLYALWGAVLPLGVGFILQDFGGFNTGMYGYNAVLCAIALSGRTVRDFLWATVAVVLSIGLQEWGMACEVITLTAPFVLSVWGVSVLKTIFRKH